MIREKRRIKKKTIGYKCWWNRSCTRKKRLLHRKFVKWKKGKSRKDDYMEEKRRFNEYLKERQEEHRKEEEVPS